MNVWLQTPSSVPLNSFLLSLSPDQNRQGRGPNIHENVWTFFSPFKAFTFPKQSSISGRSRVCEKDQPGGIDEWRLGSRRREKRLLECSFIWTSHPDKAIRGSLSFHRLSKAGRRLKEREQKDKGEWAENDKDFREDLWGNYHLEHKEAAVRRIYEHVFSVGAFSLPLKMKERFVAPPQRFQLFCPEDYL